MSQVEPITWPGLLGEEYTYYIFPINTTFTDRKPGNFIFAKAAPFRIFQWMPLYIGQTPNLSRGYAFAQQEAYAIRLGATHIHVHINEDKEARKMEKMKLLQKYKPICNEQLV